MLSVEEYEKRLESGEQYAPVTSNVGSLLSVYDTMDFQQKQTASDKAANAWHSFWNGVKGVGRGTLQGLLANQYDNYVNAEAVPDEITDDDADLDSVVAGALVGRDAMTAAANSDILKPKEVRADSAVERYAYNAIEGIGQLGAQAVMASVPGIGQVAAPASMYYQILGSEYDELREQGVDHDTAYKAAQANALIQAPLESLSLSKMMKSIPANTLSGRKVRMFVDKVLTEAVTEGLQQFPEDISKMYALNPDKTAAEIAQMAWDKKAELFVNALYAGAVAFPAAFLGGGISMTLGRQEVDRAIKKEMYNDGVAHVEESVNRIKETGINPQYAGAVINDNTKNQTVYVDGEALAGYAQEKGAEKVAESLGVSVEDIEKAAADGSTVDVKLGNFEATCAAFDGFFQEVKDGTAFEDGGYTPKKEQAEQERIKEEQKKYNAVIDEFKAEEKRIISEWQAAGINKTVAIGQAEFMVSRARALLRTSPEIALEMMRSFQVRRGENGEIQMGYGQFAGENAETADKVKLAEAQKMESEGKAADEIYKATGWFKGLDNKWRFEIPDDLNAVDLGRVKSLKEVLLARVYYNEALFDAYPELRSVVVRSSADMNEDDIGEADLSTLEINLNENLLDDEEMPSTVLHEVAHIIAKIEGYASGGDSATVRKVLKDRGEYKEEYDNLDDDDLYNRLGGEQEAREVEHRANIEKTIADAEKKIEEAKQNGDEKALKRLQFVKNIFERKLNEMPTPHKADAVIVFNGREIPYSKKQDEGLAGENKATEKKVIEAERLNLDVLEGAFNEAQRNRLRNAIPMMIESLQRDAKIQKNDNSAVIIEKLLHNVIGTRDTYLEKHKKNPNDTAIYEALVLSQKMLDYERWLVTHDGQIVRQLDRIANGDDGRRGEDGNQRDAVVDGRGEVEDASGLERNVIRQVPRSHDVNHYDPVIQEIRSTYAEKVRAGKLPQQQNNRQAKSRSKESGFFDAVKSLFQVAPNNNQAEVDFENQKAAVRARYENTDAWLKAPNGKDTNLTEDQWLTVRTENFKRWFGDWENDPENASKVVDKNGEPLVVKHWTSYDDITIFDRDRLGENTIGNASNMKLAGTSMVGFWFNSGGEEELSQYDDSYIEGFLDIKAPIEYDSVKTLSEMLPFREDDAYEADDLEQFMHEKGNEFSDILEDEGYDGIILSDEEFGGTSFVVLHSTQIKSATDNNGQFSNDDENIYHQNNTGEIKGKYNPYDNVVTMFKGADASTVIHETWHFFVEQMWNMVQSGNASEQTVKDFETLLSYAGMTREEWANADLDGRRKAHEKLAEAGETYIMEGKSPSYELRRVFRNFAKWLKAIYATIQRSENYAELTDEVREVFDRMLAAEDDIAHMERINGYFAKLPDAITENMSDATRMKVEDFIAKARQKAEDILTRRYLRNYVKDRREKIKKFKEEIRPSVEREVDNSPVYKCGYTKKDVERYRRIKEKGLAVGEEPPTPDEFIGSTFSDNPDLEDAAKLAATANPDNWLEGLDTVKADYQRRVDDAMQSAREALERGMGNGVDIVQDPDTGRYFRVSKNEPWYREFWKQHKRKPNKAEMAEMVRQLVTNDPNAPKVEGWTATNEETAKGLQEQAEQFIEAERRVQAADEVRDQLADIEKNYRAMWGADVFLLNADLAAEQNGFSSADEMMKAVEAAPTRSEAIKQRINELAREFADENLQSVEEEIRESLYNDDAALLIGVEQQLIEEYAGKAKERQANAEIAAARKQQAKNAAQADLAKMNVKEATRTSKFITAERNAAIKCAKLLAQKKFDEALTQKNLQAYWHAMAAESMKIARRQKQNEKFLKRQVGLKREAWLNETHFAAISQLFVRMGIAKPIHQEAAAQSQFENLGAYAAAMEEQFDCVDIAPWILEGSTPISDTNALTLEQNEDVVNAIKNIKAIVKAQKGVNTFNKENTWADTKALMMEKLSELKTIWTPNPNKPTQATAMERFTASMETLDSFLEYLDDATYGWFSQTWGNIIKRASDKEYEYREAYDKADAEALKKWLPDKAAERAANEEVYYDELGNSVTKHTLVKMLINLGNKENSQRLCETVPVGFERSRLWIMPDEFTNRQTAAEQTRRNLIDFLGRVLTKEDVEYAQRKIDAAEMFWGEKNELEKRVKGFGLKKVEATPVELSINGEPVVLRGGYFPLMRNGETGSHAASAEVQGDDPLQGRRIRTYHTNTSATKARSNARYPVNLFPGAETQWIYESIHDLCWRETMNDFRRVLNDQELFAMLKSKIGTARMQVFKEMLEVCADPRNSKSFSEGERMLGAAAAWLRQRTSHAAIMLNFKVIAQNYANALLYGNAIDGYTMADNLRALGTYFLKYHMPGSHKEMVDFAFSKSVFLRERCELPDITVRDIVNEKKEFAWEKAAREIGIKAMAMTDNATAIPNWLTAYNKKLNEGATEQEAIDYADALVRRVLGSSRITDVASIQRGGDIMKLMTMFQSFFNARYNEFLRMERLASKQWTQGQKQKAFANVASYVVSKWLGQTMLAMALALQNPFDVDDEDKWPELIKELKSYSFSMLGPVGQIGNAFAGAIAGMHEYTYRMSAVESTIENVNSSIKRIHSDKATTQDKVEGIVNTATLFVGVPAQLNRIFWNGVDILLNGMDPEIGDIMRRRPKKERK